MRRITLALTLGLGLAASGCGPTADPAAPAKDAAVTDGGKPVSDQPVKDAAATDGAKTVPDVAAKAPGKGGMPKGGGGGPGIPSDVMKGMQSDSYRRASSGEGPKAPPKTNDAAKPADDKKDAPAKPADGDKKDQVTLSDEEIKNIKMLPDAADQKLALAQKVCLVGDPNHLGEMGVPVKEVVKGKTVFLCCKSCVEDLKKDPDKYLAKLAK